MNRKRLIKVLAIALVLILSLSAVAFGASVTKNISVMMGGIKLFVDDEQFIPKDANGNVVQPIVYNGTTYLPARAVSEALGKAVHWDNATKSVYIGDHDSSVPDKLLKDMNVYNAQIYYETWDGWQESKVDTTKLAPVKAADGKTYPDSFTYKVHSNDSGTIFKYEFLTEGKYTKFKSSYLLSDVNKKFDMPFKIKVLGDGETLYESKTLNAGFAPQSIDCDLSGVEVMTLQLELQDDHKFYYMTDGVTLVFKDAALYK